PDPTSAPVNSLRDILRAIWLLAPFRSRLLAQPGRPTEGSGTALAGNLRSAPAAGNGPAAILGTGYSRRRLTPSGRPRWAGVHRQRSARTMASTDPRAGYPHGDHGD